MFLFMFMMTWGLVAFTFAMVFALMGSAMRKTMKENHPDSIDSVRTRMRKGYGTVVEDDADVVDFEVTTDAAEEAADAATFDEVTEPTFDETGATVRTEGTKTFIDAAYEEIKDE